MVQILTRNVYQCKGNFYRSSTFSVVGNDASTNRQMDFSTRFVASVNEEWARKWMRTHSYHESYNLMRFDWIEWGFLCDEGEDIDDGADVAVAGELLSCQWENIHVTYLVWLIQKHFSLASLDCSCPINQNVSPAKTSFLSPMISERSRDQQFL